MNNKCIRTYQLSKLQSTFRSSLVCLHQQRKTHWVRAKLQYNTSQYLGTSNEQFHFEYCLLRTLRYILEANLTFKCPKYYLKCLQHYRKSLLEAQFQSYLKINPDDQTYLPRIALQTVSTQSEVENKMSWNKVQKKNFRQTFLNQLKRSNKFE